MKIYLVLYFRSVFLCFDLCFDNDSRVSDLANVGKNQFAKIAKLYTNSFYEMQKKKTRCEGFTP